MKAIYYVISGKVESFLSVHVKRSELTDFSRSAAYGLLGVTSVAQSHSLKE